MIENRRGLTIFSHTMLILGIAVILFPLYVAFVAATLDSKATLTVNGGGVSAQGGALTVTSKQGMALADATLTARPTPRCPPTAA